MMMIATQRPFFSCRLWIFLILEREATKEPTRRQYSTEQVFYVVDFAENFYQNTENRPTGWACKTNKSNGVLEWASVCAYGWWWPIVRSTAVKNHHIARENGR